MVIDLRAALVKHSISFSRLSIYFDFLRLQLDVLRRKENYEERQL